LIQAWPQLKFSGESPQPEIRPMRKLVILTLAAASLLATGCNTIEGVGRDVSAAGQAVTGAAQDTK
jgi:entericidin B